MSTLFSKSYWRLSGALPYKKLEESSSSSLLFNCCVFRSILDVLVESTICYQFLDDFEDYIYQSFVALSHSDCFCIAIINFEGNTCQSQIWILCHVTFCYWFFKVNSINLARLNFVNSFTHCCK